MRDEKLRALIAKPEYTASEKVVFIALEYMCAEEGEESVVRTLKDLSDATGIHRTTVIKCLKTLQEKGLVEITNRIDTNGKVIANKYAVIRKMGLEDSQEITGSQNAQEGGRDTHNGGSRHSFIRLIDLYRIGLSESNSTKNKQGKSLRSFPAAGAQNTLIAMPAAPSAAPEPKTKRERALAKIAAADWDNITAQDLMYYFVECYNKQAPTPLVVDAYNGRQPGVFRDYFVSKYKLSGQEAIAFIEEFVGEYFRVKASAFSQYGFGAFKNNGFVQALVDSAIKHKNFNARYEAAVKVATPDMKDGPEIF